MFHDLIQYIINFHIDIKKPEDILLLLIIVLSALALGLLVGVIFVGLYRLFCIGINTSPELERKGSVVSKRFIQSSVTYIPIIVSNGKTTTTTNLVPQFHEAQYLVDLEIEGYDSGEVDSAELFRAVEKGEKVSVVLVEKEEYRRWNPSKIISQYHEVVSVKLVNNHEIFI